MSPLLHILMEKTDHPLDTQESWRLAREISAQQDRIGKELSFDVIDDYTTLCDRYHALECEVSFERGFFTCAQLFVEILSKYSS